MKIQAPHLGKIIQVIFTPRSSVSAKNWLQEICLVDKTPLNRYKKVFHTWSLPAGYLLYFVNPYWTNNLSTHTYVPSKIKFYSKK
jgi:hypothetical protein